MAWYHDLAGGAARTVGRAYDYATPGAGTSTLTNAGRAINDPNQVFAGDPLEYVSGIGRGGNSGFVPAGVSPTASAFPIGGSPISNKTAGVLGATSGSQSGAAGGGWNGSGPAADPYAQWGGRANYDNLVSGFGNQKSNILGSATDAANIAAAGRHSSILDFISSLQSGQRGIDERGVQNELAKQQGRTSILDMVGRGIRSGGVMLANKNAADSSAAGALARAYGQVGQQEMGKVNNQGALEDRNIGLAQEDLNAQRATGLRKFSEDVPQQVGNIVTNARNALAGLDAAMMQASIPERIQIEQEKAKIHNQVAGIINQYDPELQQGAAGVNPTSGDARRRTAFGLANAGVAAENPFNFSSEVPAQAQGTGPFPSELPLFTAPRRRIA